MSDVGRWSFTKRACQLACVCGAIGCNPAPTNPFEGGGGVPVVEAVLTNASAVQVVKLSWVRGLDEPLETDKPISSARVAVTSAGDRYVFAETFAGNYQAEFGVVADTRYAIQIVLQDGREITGSTVSPGVPEIISPPSGTIFGDVEFGALSLQWTASKHAAGYGLFLRKSLAPSTGKVFGGYTGDTSAVMEVVPECEDGVCLGVILIVSAIKADLLRSLGFLTSDPPGDVDSLSGALGLFTAVAVDSVVLQP